MKLLFGTTPTAIYNNIINGQAAGPGILHISDIRDLMDVTVDLYTIPTTAAVSVACRHTRHIGVLTRGDIYHNIYIRVYGIVWYCVRV